MRQRLQAVGLHRGRLPDDELDRRLEAATAAEPTYDHVGSTLGPGTPGRRVRTRRRDAGCGAGTFGAARSAIRSWSAHAALGARLHPRCPALVEGGTLLVVLEAGPLAVVAPNRIVRVVDEDDVFGFAYGTLPGHPERGEESFVARRTADGRVGVEIGLDAVPAGALAAVAPAVRLLQEAAVRRCLAGMVPDGRYWGRR